MPHKKAKSRKEERAEALLEISNELRVLTVKVFTAMRVGPKATDLGKFIKMREEFFKAIKKLL